MNAPRQVCTSIVDRRRSNPMELSMSGTQTETRNYHEHRLFKAAPEPFPGNKDALWVMAMLQLYTFFQSSNALPERPSFLPLVSNNNSSQNGARQTCSESVLGTTARAQTCGRKSVREVEGRVQWFGRTTIGVGSAHIMVCAVNKMSWKSDVLFHANINISSWCGIPGQDRRTETNPSYSTRRRPSQNTG